MTEVEWLECTDEGLLWESDFFWCKTPERKFQLFAVAACRRIWPLFPDERSRQAVETLERVADGLSEPSALRQVWEQFPEDENIHAGLSDAQSHALSAAITCLLDTDYRLAGTVASYCQAALKAWKSDTTLTAPVLNPAEDNCELIRELLGNPFRPVTLQTYWKTSVVVGLARGAHDNRSLPAGILDPNHLAILSDALEDAGCDNTDILDHLRSPGPHVRGCWALDLILGKS